MFNLGGFAILLYALAIAQFIVPQATATPFDPTQSVTPTSNSALFRRPPFARDNETLVVRADSGCHVEPYKAPAVTDQVFPPFNEAQATVYRYRQQQSVNLGSWFVHENWMTQSMFTCASGKKVSEIDIATGWGSVANAQSKLESHWDNFVAESDFAYLASIGINTVRLPIGYWSLGPDFTEGTPFEKVGQAYQNSWPRIVRAINQAGQHGIGVLVDLHGAVGSQNGQAHSGISDGQTNLFNNQGNIDKTINVLTFLTKQLVQVNNVVGIQILNEPKNVASLTDFYNKAIDAMRGVSPEAKTFPLYIHDGFDLNKFSNYVAGRQDFVVQDHHSYFVYTANDKAKTPAEHTADIKGSISSNLHNAFNKQHHNLVVDEWSCALTSDSLKKAKSSGQASASEDFCTAQLNVYGKTTAGWSFWAYMKENCENDAGWCFKAAVGKNLPKTFFSYLGSNGKAPASIFSGASSNLSARPPNMTKTDNTTTNNTTKDEHDRSTTLTTPTCNSHKARSFLKLHKRSKHARVALEKRDDAQEANQRGYKDGVQAAKDFAAFSMSKLGFDKQYIHDNAAKLGSGVVKSSNEDDYSDGFLKGLQDGEATVSKAQ